MGLFKKLISIFQSVEEPEKPTRPQTPSDNSEKPELFPKDFQVDPEAWERARQEVEKEERKRKGPPVMTIPSD
jgi:hypothetical protein